MSWQFSGGGGGAATPGGINGDIQFNNNGSLGGETLVPLNHGGTNADLSATGGASQVLKQVSAGAAVTVGQLAFTDISGSASAAQMPVISATGKGYLVGGRSTISDYNNVGNAHASDWTFAVNKVAFIEFSIPVAITIRQVITVVGTLNSTAHYGVGIYDKNGNLLADSGGLSANVTAGTAQTTALRQGSVTLNPGIYYFAWTSDTSALDMYFVGGSLAVVTSAVQNANFPRYGSAANTSTAGQLPATLGTLTASTSNSSQPFLAIFEA